MQQKTHYANGQAVYTYKGKQMTYFYKNGKIKAEGLVENDKMEGEWKFYRESGQLWQIGHFKEGKKNGSWIRYDKLDKIEYQEDFSNDKLVKQGRDKIS